MVIDCKVKYGTRIKGLLIKHFGNTGDSNKNEIGRITNMYVLMTVHKRTNNIIRKWARIVYTSQKNENLWEFLGKYLYAARLNLVRVGGSNIN